MGRYCRLVVPERHMGNNIVEGGFCVMFDADHLESVIFRSDGWAYVKVAGETHLIDKKEADRLLDWLNENESKE